MYLQISLSKKVMQHLQLILPFKVSVKHHIQLILKPMLNSVCNSFYYLKSNNTRITKKNTF